MLGAISSDAHNSPLQMARPLLKNPKALCYMILLLGFTVNSALASLLTTDTSHTTGSAHCSALSGEAAFTTA